MRRTEHTSASPQGRWKSLREQIAFRFERLLSRGPYTKIGVLSMVLPVTLVGGALAWLIPSGRFGSLGEALW